MTRQEIADIVSLQRDFYATGQTLSIRYRIEALKKLRQYLIDNETKIADAIKADLGKSASESYMCETGLTISEISFMLKHIKSYAKEKRVLTPLAQFASRSFVKPMPYGVALIMSPWNYPLLLTLSPLVNALAAGNTAIVKPSAYSPNTSAVIKEIIEAVFDKRYVAVVTGGREENAYLLDEKFDYIFFTGGKTVGRMVLEKAAPHLTPVTLELGGKSPCIVDKTANLKLAAKRIVFGKYLNCGQTCVAPDYILCEASVKDKFIEHVVAEIKAQYGTDALNNEAYGKIVNAKHYERLLGLIDKTKVVCGGRGDAATLKIEPTVMNNVTFDDAVMKEEIFGPIMPVLTFNRIEEVIDIVNSHEKPLAFYVFASDKKFIRRLTGECAFGGGCINDTIIHLATSRMGFGGVGESGMGAYHGKTGFDTFSHHKSIVDKKTWIDLPMRYQPYKKFYDSLIKMFLK
ncbi:MAG: aldehyde dehydrogenase [Lachnospiraceae bacterium]|nr:aldehyde dehydrogenase [Lachnospiraceae bacterium]